MLKWLVKICSYICVCVYYKNAFFLHVRLPLLYIICQPMHRWQRLQLALDSYTVHLVKCYRAMVARHRHRSNAPQTCSIAAAAPNHSADTQNRRVVFSTRHRCRSVCPRIGYDCCRCSGQIVGNCATQSFCFRPANDFVRSARSCRHDRFDRCAARKIVHRGRNARTNRPIGRNERNHLDCGRNAQTMSLPMAMQTNQTTATTSNRNRDGLLAECFRSSACAAHLCQSPRQAPLGPMHSIK